MTDDLIKTQKMQVLRALILKVV